MKNISFCYNEHAIKVSDSYCSGHSNRKPGFSTPSSSIQKTVTSIYKTKKFLIKLTWTKNQLYQGFSISLSDHYPYPKITKTSGLLTKTRGSNSFHFRTSNVEIIWDLYHARYDNNNGPEPVTGFYVVVLVDNKEVALTVGELGHGTEIKKLVSDMKVSENSLISRCERFSGTSTTNNNSSVYMSRSKFCDTGLVHDIMIKYEGSGLSVYIDKKNVIEIKRLQWNFRGNQTIFLDGLLVDFMWDVHDWFFGPVKGCGVFMFRTRSGLDSRLWLEEKKIEEKDDGEKVGFSLLICACKNPD